MTTASSPGEHATGALSLGPWLKQRRRVLDMTQDELAQRATCSLATIRKIEAGDLLPSKQLAHQIAIALGIPEAEHAAFVTFARAERAAVLATAFVEPAPSSEYFGQPRQEPRRQRMPAQLTPLVGREWEVQASCALLRRPVARLLTLTGSPGCGKTRLALAIAEELQQDFSGGAVFVPLAPIANNNLVIGAIAHALNLQSNTGHPTVELLADALGGQQMLLVLDNFEQVVDAAPILAELLMAAAGLKLLVTSRTLLRIYGEHEFPIPPLPLPDTDNLPLLEELILYPSVELFVQRAQAAQPSFTLTNENAQAVVQLCTWVEGLPLAIEMAAAQVKSYPPQVLVKQLGQRLTTLVNGPRYLAPRQQTLRGAIEWSYNLLDRGERRTFRAMAVFVGSCSREAVSALLGDGDQTNRLESLVAHSLLKHLPQHDAPHRYVMLETIREYAIECLASDVEAAAIPQAHANFFLTMAQTARSQLAGDQQEKWLDQLENDNDNMRTALAWCMAHNVVVGLQLAAALGEFWTMRGHLQEGRSYLTRMLVLKDRTVPLWVQADALHTSGYLAFRQGDHLEAEPILTESLGLYQTLGDRKGIAATLHHLGIAAFHQNHYAEAQKLYEEALEIYWALGKENETAVVLKDLGLVAKDLGNLEQAMSFFEQSLTLQRSAGNKYGIARCLTSMSVVAYWQGDYARAAELAYQSLALQRELGDKLGVAYTLENLGMALYKQGDSATAVQQMEECLTLFRATGDKMGVVLALDNLGIMALAQARIADAVQYHRESLTVAWQIREQRRIAFCLEGLARAAGLSERAAQLFASAATLRANIHAPILPGDLADHEQQVARLRLHLGDESFAQAWQLGESRSLDQAVNYALAL